MFTGRNPKSLPRPGQAVCLLRLICFCARIMHCLKSGTIHCDGSNHRTSASYEN